MGNIIVMKKQSQTQIIVHFENLQQKNCWSHNWMVDFMPYKIKNLKNMNGINWNI
jgi:hypothetical protein